VVAIKVIGKAKLWPAFVNAFEDVIALWGCLFPNDLKPENLCRVVTLIAQ